MTPTVMLFKAGGALLVLLACSLLGFYCAGLESFRIQDLTEFGKALLMLASEIEYAATPLPEAMRHLARRTEQPVAGLFADFAEKLSANVNGETAYRLWEAAVSERKRQCYLAEEDWETVLAFGKTLGYLDKKMQLNAIGLANQYIENKVKELRLGCDKNRRMYRSLGVLGGALLVVVLL